MKILTAALAAAFLSIGGAAVAECSWMKQAETPQTVVKLPTAPQDDAES